MFQLIHSFCEHYPHCKVQLSVLDFILWTQCEKVQCLSGFILWTLYSQQIGLAVLIAPPIGGVLYNLGGKPLPFYVVAGLCAVVFILQSLNLCCGKSHTKQAKLPSLLKSITLFADPLILISCGITSSTILWQLQVSICVYTSYCFQIFIEKRFRSNKLEQYYYCYNSL